MAKSQPAGGLARAPRAAPTLQVQVRNGPSSDTPSPPSVLHDAIHWPVPFFFKFIYLFLREREEGQRERETVPSRLELTNCEGLNLGTVRS